MHLYKTGFSSHVPFSTLAVIPWDHRYSEEVVIIQSEGKIEFLFNIT